jgi:hypothetical protein
MKGGRKDSCVNNGMDAPTCNGINVPEWKGNPAHLNRTGGFCRYKGFPTCQAHRTEVNRGSDSRGVGPTFFGCATPIGRALSEQQRVRTGDATTGHSRQSRWTADPDERRAWGTRSIAELAAIGSMAAETPTEPRSLPMQVQPLHINAIPITRRQKRQDAQCGEPAERGIIPAMRCPVRDFVDVVGAPFPLAGRAGGWVVQRADFMARLARHAGSLKDSALVSTAQAMRAFFAAMATMAFQ